MRTSGPIRRPYLIAAGFSTIVAAIGSSLGFFSLLSFNTQGYATPLAAVGLAALLTAVVLASRAGRARGLLAWGSVTLGGGQILLLAVAVAAPSATRCPTSIGPCFSPFLVCGPIVLSILVGGVLMIVALIRMASPSRPALWVVPPGASPYPVYYGSSPWTPPAPSVPPPGSLPSPPKCPRCGREGLAGAVYCITCGERLT